VVRMVTELCSRSGGPRGLRRGYATPLAGTACSHPVEGMGVRLL
jgi:hypothetical protein